MQLLKHFVKKYLWRWVFFKKIYGHAVKLNECFVSKLDKSSFFLNESLNIFTTDDEDGILLNIFAKTKITNKTFIDIGSNDCINSNCANLAFHHGWSGIFIDGNRQVLERGKYIYSRHFGKKISRFLFVESIVNPKNIDALLAMHNTKKEIDLLSIDLDGNDYFIWDAIKSISPKVVVAEVQVEKGYTEFIPEMISEFEPYEMDLPKGASALSMLKLANEKGYELVAVNKGCYNLFFVRQDSLYNMQRVNLELILQNK